LKTDFNTASDVVTSEGAVRIGIFLGSLGTVGQRMKKAVEADIKEVIADCSIVPSWLMKGTLHFVSRALNVFCIGSFLLQLKLVILRNGIYSER
jgi:hypothetical protein